LPVHHDLRRPGRQHPGRRVPGLSHRLRRVFVRARLGHRHDPHLDHRSRQLLLPALARQRMRRRRHVAARDSRRAAVRWALILLLAAYVLAPFASMVSVSFKPESEVFARELSLLPREATLDNYRMIFTFIPYPRFFLNSLLVAVVTTLVSTVVSTL